MNGNEKNAQNEVIVNVAEIVNERKKLLKKRVKDLNKKGIEPKIYVIIANKEASSVSYVSKKKQLCEELDILYKDDFLEESVDTDTILNLIDDLNKDDSVHAILVQLPLYKHLDEKKILNRISKEKDVDGFTNENLGMLLSANSDATFPCTPKGIITILESLGETFVGKHAVVVGRSNIVGKPAAQLLLNKDCTVTVCHSKTDNLSKYTKDADILVVAVGKPKFITSDMVKEGATVIDVGINRVNGKLVGDVDTEEVSKVAKHVTKVPGGVGITTVFSLGENIIELIEKKNSSLE